MPTHIRAMVQWQCGSMLPRDIHQITPSFRAQTGFDPIGGVDWDTLAQDLLDKMSGGTGFIFNKTNQCTVKLYEIKDPVPGVPNRPKSVKTKNPGVATEASIPRELALCLSYYGGNNNPDNRGRLYVPAWLWVTAPGARPVAGDITKLDGLAAALAALGGANVDWGAWSPTKKHFTRAEHFFIDDEWDVQRRRGNEWTQRTVKDTSG